MSIHKILSDLEFLDTFISSTKHLMSYLTRGAEVSIRAFPVNREKLLCPTLQHLWSGHT